jgi:geranylgeranyl reductase family protein
LFDQDRLDKRWRFRAGLRRGMSTATTDLLIVGLGPAGSAAAAVAAAQGLTVVAFDRRQQAGDPVQCAEFVPAMIGQDVADIGKVSRQHIQAMATFVECEDPDMTKCFRGQMIDRRAFDASLVVKAQEAGADCRFGACVQSLRRDGVALLSGGETIRAKVVIGADGPRSRVGRAIGQVNAPLVETRQVTVPQREPSKATDIFLSADVPGGYAWLFPKGNVANLGLGVDPAWRKILKPRLTWLHRKLAAEGRVGPEVLGRTGGAIPVGGLSALTGQSGATPILLAGDAAGLANPVTGAGINAAVISGTLAGRAAAAWLDGDGRALQDYRDEVADIFGASIDRALRRRAELLECYADDGRPSPPALRQGWIAYPQYWARQV